ncbi:YggS family pyridoxal phosphate-dependent enzyme [Bittarella massiliensis (ex Durand et al. 2017)]|uniref:YggS family pyridoxal phosphate-dependent enzyme n=1 Tax=Bittarella massiliensis (ex Durand et al. 2017) TaxID=1720313 RepID=UPI001AA179E8|nr:YggS family pyridoxal phosphate-dependent enzyme [Bittarella massiliensis (ex Durand et al. 2017)]
MENISDPARVLRDIRGRIDRAARAAGRSGDEVALMAVTKTVPAERVNQFIDSGISLIGENRVQEFLDKYDSYHKEGLKIAFIGHLQRNKVKYIADKVDRIESVDSLALAEEISRRCAAIGRRMDILLEVNIGGEASKSGFAKGELEGVLPQIAALPGVRITGLMAIPPAAEGDGAAPYFREMEKLFIDIKHERLDNVFMETLSLGMSGDFETAVSCGSTQVRLGSILFGERQSQI